MSEVIQEPPVQEPVATPFSSKAWTESTPAAPPPEVKADAPPASPEKGEPQTQAPVSEEILDVKEWVKREFEVDDPAIIKQQLKELNELKQKAQTPAQIQYANEQSKKFHEALVAGKDDDIYKFLHEKKQLERLTGSDVTKLSAEDIIKYSISQKNKDLSADEIDFVFKQDYSFPPKPVKDLTDTDDDYADKVKVWEDQVNTIEKKLIIAAKMARPELEKLKSELTYTLPDIQKGVDPKEAEAQQKELERIDGLRKQYLQHLESDYKNFTGFETKYKDEEVEIPVSFAITPEEQVALKTELETFNIDGFISQRWFNEDNSPKINQIMSDITLLRKGENVLQKVANEVGAKIKEHYIKMRGNIDVRGNTQQSFQPNQQNGNGKSPYAVDAWSETPPVITQN